MKQRFRCIAATARDMKYMCLCGVSLMALMQAGDAFARNPAAPEKPSVEINLEALQAIREQSMGAPLDPVTNTVTGSASSGLSPAMPAPAKTKAKKEKEGKPVSPPPGDRQVPMMNRGMPTAPKFDPYTDTPGLGLVPALLDKPQSPGETAAPLGTEADFPSRPMRGVAAKYAKPRSAQKFKKKEELAEKTPADPMQPLTVPAMGEVVENPDGTFTPVNKDVDFGDASAKTDKKDAGKHDVKTVGDAGKSGKVVKSDQPVKSENVLTAPAFEKSTGDAGGIASADKPFGMPFDAPSGDVARDPFGDMVTSPPLSAKTEMPPTPNKHVLPDLGKLDGQKLKEPESKTLSAPDKHVLPDVGKLEAPKPKDSEKPADKQALPDLGKLEMPKPKMPELKLPDVPPAKSGIEPPKASLPEPDMKKMELKEFPAIAMPPAATKPTPPAPSSLPMPDLPKEKPAVPMPPVAGPAAGLPDINKLQMPAIDKEVPPGGKPGAVSAAMPSLSKGFDELISKDASKGTPPKLPKLPDVGAPSKDTVILPSGDAKNNPANKVALPVAPVAPPDSAVTNIAELPEPPASTTIEDPAVKMMASLPPLNVPEMKDGKAVASGKSLVSIDYPEQETQVPVNMQRQLKELATKLVASNQAVRVEGVSGGTPDQALAARRAAYSRAMLVRSVLIDNGVNHANITIKTRAAEGTEKADRVDIIAQ